MGELFAVFFNVVVPVFALVFIGYFAIPALKLEVRTLSRTAYYIFVPALIFTIISRAELQAASAANMLVYIVLVHLACGGLGFGIARLLKCPRDVTAAYIMIAVSGNVGNFGLPLIQFRFGEHALAQATIYFVGVMLISMIISVAVASWARDGKSTTAVFSVFKTPALIAVAPALIVNIGNIEVPLMVSRITGLLGSAMVPTLLVTLGGQLASHGKPVINTHMVSASMVRLLGAPAIALILSIPMGITGLERATGILQSSMPVAIMPFIIAMEYELMPEFITSAALFSSIAGMGTLTILLSCV